MSTTIPSLTSLLQRTNIDDHDEILKAAEHALKENKSNPDAQHARVVALLKLDRFDDALRAFETAGAGLKEKARLEYAYALYKSGQAAEAAATAHQSEERGHKHVEAQASYRTENFQRAAELYRQLGRVIQDDAIADLRINAGAVDAQLEWARQGDLVQKEKPAREDLEAFETAYNAACGCIARGELAQSEVLLKRAKDLCTSSEYLSEEEKSAELAPITVQQVYVLIRQGKTADAELLAKSIETKTIPDASTRLIAEVNGVAATDTTNPFLAQRVLAQSARPAKPDHLFDFQASILTQNRHAIALQSLKFGGTADSTSAQVAKETAPTLDARINGLAVINAAAHAKSQTGKEGLKHILPLLEKRPNDVGLILTIVQLYVMTGNTGSAISLLESFFKRLEQSGNTAELDVRFAPGLVGTLVGLYQSSGRRGHVQAEFARAAQHWRRKSKDWPNSVANLLKAAGSALLDSPHSEHTQLARDIFADLHARDAKDPFAAAGLLAASADAASTPSTTLRPIDRLTLGIDVDALEEAGIARPPLSADAAGVTTRKRRAEDSKPKKPKRIRKSRLPKDYDASKKPDPERWLPLRDRSAYRPKGKKGKARQNLLSQGAAPTPGDSEGSRPSTPAAEVVKGKQLGGAGAGAGGGNARKKKGRK